MKNVKLLGSTIACITMPLALSTANAAKQPNVIIILADDQGYGDFSCHGNPYIKTPNIDEMYQNSVRLTDFHTSPVSTPTRGSLLTGQDPMHNGAWSFGFSREVINPDVTLMPKIFKDAGYTTGHFGKWHLGDNYPFRPQDVGFDQTITFGGAAAHQIPGYWQNDNFDDYYIMQDGTYKQFEGYCTDIWFDLSKKFISECQDKNEPFLLYLPTNVLHWPTYVDPKYSEPYSSVHGDFVGNFYGMIANLDENVGALRKFLRDKGLAEDTIIVYFHDNGGTNGVDLYNAGMTGHKGNYYEGGHRAACFIEWQGGKIDSGNDFTEATQVQDLLPTLLDLCNVKAPKKVSKRFDGVSLARNIQDCSKTIDDRMFVIQWSWGQIAKKWSGAVVWNKWRLLQNKQLYNIESDPAQKNNVIKQYPEIAAKMNKHYEEWWNGKRLQQVINDVYRPIIGGKVNPVDITCNEWLDRTSKENVTEQLTVWNGGRVNGIWKLEFAESARYRFTLRRYPKEANFPLAGAYPSVQREFHLFPECKALPIAAAEVNIDGQTQASSNVTGNETYVSYEVDVTKGDHTIKTFFYDKEQQEIGGAYYLEIMKL